MSSRSDEPPHSTDTNNTSSQVSVDDGCTQSQTAQTFQGIAWEAVQVRIRDTWVLNLRPGNRRGWFWIHGFDVQRRGTGGRGQNPVWLCGHCVKKHDPKPTNLIAANTHNIEQHLANKHRVFHPDPERPTRLNAKRPRNQPALSDFMSTRKRKNEDHQDALISRFDIDIFQRLLVRWIVNKNLSFRIAEHEELHDLINYLNPIVKKCEAFMTHNTIRDKIIGRHETYKIKIIEKLGESPSRVHIAFDGWTSKNRHSFFSINAFFLDQSFTPRKIVLGLPTLSMSHTGENICEAVATVLKGYNIFSSDKIGNFTLDNASNNDKAIVELGRKLGWQDPLHKQIRCIGHIIHLVVEALLTYNKVSTLKDADAHDFDEWNKRGPVGKLHNLVVWIHRSNKATSFLRRLQKEDKEKKDKEKKDKEKEDKEKEDKEKEDKAKGAGVSVLDVILDNSTRWLSQHHMIERALKLKVYLERMVFAFTVGSDALSKSARPQCLAPQNQLTHQDWELLSWFNGILRQFNTCLLRLEGDGQARLRKGGTAKAYGSISEVVSSYVFLVGTLDQAKAEAAGRPDFNYLIPCIDAASIKLHKYYDMIDQTPVFYAATVLHPTMRWEYLASIHTKHHPEKIYKARELVRKLWDEQYRDLPIQWESPVDLPSAVTAENFGGYDAFRSLHQQACSRPSTSSATNINEFDQWLSISIPRDPSFDDNPLEYWFSKRFEYPRLTKMAIDVLSTPAMSAECERTFSSAGAMASPMRSRLESSTIAASQTLRSWYKAGLIEDSELSDGLFTGVVDELAGLMDKLTTEDD